MTQNLYEQAEAARWGVSPDAFDAALRASAAHAFAGRRPDPAEVDRYLRSLHLCDLALAVACAEGDEAAWNHFVLEYRPVLYRAGAAIDPAGGRELADSLYAELFGLRERDGRRQSLFRYYQGRSRLATWLRAVLAQRHVDRLRSASRLDPLPEDESRLPTPPVPREPDPDQSRRAASVQRALSEAIAALAPRDRLRLSLYHAQGMTLAAIGQLLREHEATVSRHLARTRRAIREAVERSLSEKHGLDEAARAECLRAAVEDPEALDVTELMGVVPVGSGKADGPDRSN